MEIESNLLNAYMEAFEIACTNLKKKNPDEVAENTGAIFDLKNYCFNLKYLNNNYSISFSTGDVINLDSKEQVAITVKILILHYLIKAYKNPISGNLISFREISEGGSIYYNTFQKRAIIPLVTTFSKDSNKFYTACEKLDGKKEMFGHVSTTLRIFPYIPATYIIWFGDEEVPDSGTILFDESITGYLPTEDIVLAASLGTYALIKQI